MRLVTGKAPTSGLFIEADPYCDWWVYSWWEWPRYLNDKHQWVVRLGEWLWPQRRHIEDWLDGYKAGLKDGQCNGQSDMETVFTISMLREKPIIPGIFFGGGKGESDGSEEGASRL